jgi:putative acetyltransferase
MPEIIPLNPEQAEEARRLIYLVADTVFPSERTPEENLVYYQKNWPMHDLDDIQHSYFNNGGVFLVVRVDGQMIGTGAIRYLEEGVCELKRFWFLPAFHGSGLAAQLLARLEAIAIEKGYHSMRLETSPLYQPRACAFYHKYGFFDIPRYGDDPDDTGMEKTLQQA